MVHAVHYCKSLVFFVLVVDEHSGTTLYEQQ